MKRALLISSSLVAACAVFVAVMSVCQVPAGYEYVRRDNAGDIRVYAPGLHWVPWGRGDTFEYPTGPLTRRVPPRGEMTLTDGAGAALRVGLEFDLEIPPGMSAALLTGFSSNFDEGFARLVVSTAQHRAVNSQDAAAQVFADGVGKHLARELARYNIDVRAARATYWRGRTIENPTRTDQ